MSEQRTSVVMVVKNVSENINMILERLHENLKFPGDKQILIIDYGSSDNTVEILEECTLVYPNIEVMCLLDSNDRDTAYVAGIEHCLGDCIVLFDPTSDSPETIKNLVYQIVNKKQDIAVASIFGNSKEGFLYRGLSALFIKMFRWLTGLDMRMNANRFRAINKRVAQYITMHDSAAITQQTIPLLGKFSSVMITQEHPALIKDNSPKSLMEGVQRAMSVIISTTAVPLRITTVACTLGAIVSLLESLYTVGVYVFRSEVAPGWTTLSLQISGMFFLISIALAMMSEHILNIKGSKKVSYHIARSFRSPVIDREEKLNLKFGSEKS